MKKNILIYMLVGLFFLILSGNYIFFLTVNPQDRARRYMEKAFEEYKAAVRNNPGDRELLEEFATILTAKKGEINAMVEMGIFFNSIGMEEEGDSLLLEAVIQDRDKTVEYIDFLIADARSPRERADLYVAALKVSPDEGEYWYMLGKLYLGMNFEDKGVEALEKAFSHDIREEDLFYYLGSVFTRRGDYRKAEFYINEGLKEKESVELHRLLYSLYSRQRKHDFAEREMERIRQAIARLQAVSPPEEEVEVAHKPVEVETSEPLPVVFPGISPYKFFYVSKDKQELFVYLVDETGFRIIESVPVTTGLNAGPKEVRGDEKTPHGAYMLISRIDGNTLPARYGIMAYPLNYPNHIDRRLNRTGDGIWLHGTPIERPPYHSEGCLVVSDRDLKKLMEHIIVGRTFVGINMNKGQIDKKVFSEVFEAVELWIKGWESLDIEKYMAAYDEAFYSGGMDKAQFSADKERINRPKTYIRVGLSNMQVIPYGKTPFGEMMLVSFRQRYNSSNFSSNTGKLLYMVRRQDGWKIIAEEVM